MGKPAVVVGVAEIAERFGVSKQLVDSWSAKNPHFPKPIRVLASGRVWRESDITRWAEKYRPDLH